MPRRFMIVFAVACSPRSTAPAAEIHAPNASVSVVPIATSPPHPLEVEAQDDDWLDLRKPPRDRTLITAEAQALVQLLTVTPASSPDRRMLLWRIAEEFVELRKVGVATASQSAIQYYNDLVRTYPNAPQVDEVRYNLALEYLATGDVTAARNTLHELITNSPISRRIPYAYFAIGELLFRDTKSDPSKAGLAKQAYLEVIKIGVEPIAKHARERLRQLP